METNSHRHLQLNQDRTQLSDGNLTFRVTHLEEVTVNLKHQPNRALIVVRAEGEDGSKWYGRGTNGLINLKRSVAKRTKAFGK